ncbi:MAG: bifunctional phosphoribosylaminoimidazolecarboxamide formyltransferase/IMP cyclohydrolase [Candidatus Cloacimonetes bacterium]|nr:bifunctional phosphoribosylaminoimidazolecarboxamide formyltransferase/IMP cyclohydrolase [Candidatus Cloacimonadota bacterium]
MKRYALISVSDKTGIETLAQGLEALGYQILSTSNTARHLKNYCQSVVEISDLTAFPEILDGRVKTLHPIIHAGILARRDNAEHTYTLQEMDISPIDVVVVNLYPFAQTRARKDATHHQIIENIDIGGPTLIRAAAKNYEHVYILTDPADYQPTLEYLAKDHPPQQEWRRHLAAKAFAMIQGYDAQIAAYFQELDGAQDTASLPSSLRLEIPRLQTLRYGENPHQRGGFYTRQTPFWNVLHGKELSFNNVLDLDSTLRALRLFELPTAVITKHTNPCGIASSHTLVDAYRKAFATDTQSPFGGIVGVNQILDMETAQEINRIFTEVIIAPGYAPGVLDWLKKKKNRRLVSFDLNQLHGDFSSLEIKSTLTGFLAQDWDLPTGDEAAWQVVTQLKPDPQTMEDLRWGWKVVSLLRSNAIAISSAQQVLGLGMGQTSRVDAVHQALWKAENFDHRLQGSICASDGFFPFADSIRLLHQKGIRAIIQPGGSVGDADVIASCNELGISMIFTGKRHFRH